ncbi:hypothetical protein PCANC_15691 [Puccinia coronata f. sp. avenae]|uniref:Uncharacterized protein n=1 Tax=Puccinia coronata f. sp. avenae TaxID=200324 RepID=A0A2N5SQF9_9BASI|nr:hypothetical protein PCANC_15691 [Puccinia coronata f. sp. avenae]
MQAGPSCNLLDHEQNEVGRPHGEVGGVDTVNFPILQRYQTNNDNRTDMYHSTPMVESPRLRTTSNNYLSALNPSDYRSTIQRHNTESVQAHQLITAQDQSLLQMILPNRKRNYRGENITQDSPKPKIQIDLNIN